jgi:putative redox protein
MALPKPKLNKKITLNGACRSSTRTDVTTRDVGVTIDEPWGTNHGLNPIETLVSSLIGCTNVTTHKLAEVNGVEIDAMSIEAELTYDQRGVMFVEEIDVPFTEITLKIELISAVDDAALAKIKADLPRFCPLAKAIRQSGTRIIENWTVTRP